VVLTAADQAVLPLLQNSEARRYESVDPMRFGNSDLFLIGPMTEYLREYPVGPKPRTIFLGDSIVWGYLLEAGETIPANFQHLNPDVKVLNLGSNGFDAVSAYLVTQALMDSTDTFYYVYEQDDLDRRPHPMLARLIPMSSADASRFELELPPPWTSAFNRAARSWKLARYSYRLQGALFGNSGRQYLYSKGKQLGAFLRGSSGQEGAVEGSGRTALRVQWSSPSTGSSLSEGEAGDLARRHPMLWEYASLLAGRQKRGVIIEFAHHKKILGDSERRQFNAHFRPFVRFAKLTVPGAYLMADEAHLTAEGTRAVASALSEHTHSAGLASR